MPTPFRCLAMPLGACLAVLLSASEVPESEAGLRARLSRTQGPERVALQLELANQLENRRPSEALKLAREGIALAQEAGDKAKQAAFLSTAAFCCTATGDFPDSVAFGKQALALGTELGDRDRAARAHNTLGIAYTFMGVYSQALEEGLAALRIRESLRDERAVDQSLNLLGVVYHHSGQYEKAMDYYNRILERAAARQDFRRLILAKHNLGFSLFKLGRFEEALRCHQEALALSLRTNETSHRAYAYFNLGMVEAELRQFGPAGRHLEQALAEYRAQGQKHGEVQALRSMARFLLLTGRMAKGISMASEGAVLAQKINAREELRECYQLLSEMCEKSGNIEASLRYFKLAVQTKEAITSVAESSRIAEATMRLVTLKKDGEIEALRKEQVISGLRMEKQRYVLVLLVATSGFLVTGLVVLGRFNRRMGEHRKSLQKSNEELARINGELQDRMLEIRTLSGLLPICAHCKKIRDDEGYWNQLEGYISERTTAVFTHGICPQCAEAHFPKPLVPPQG